MRNCENCYHRIVCDENKERNHRISKSVCKHYKDKSLISEALEKQIPYKPKEYEDRYYGCRCGNILLMKWREYLKELTPKSEGLPYCLACGQALDWSESDE